jgi:hypothetical protein
VLGRSGHAARRTVVARERLQLRHDYLETEHLLPGLLVRTTVCVAACVASACASPVVSLTQADELASEVVAQVGVEPDDRTILERTNNPVNTVADTVMLRWEDFPPRPDPLEVWAAAIERAGLEVVRLEPSFPEGRPNSGEPDHAEIVGCGMRDRLRIGVSVSLGQVGDAVAVATEVGGPPATAGCPA